MTLPHTIGAVILVIVGAIVLIWMSAAFIGWLITTEMTSMHFAALLTVFALIGVMLLNV